MITGSEQNTCENKMSSAFWLTKTPQTPRQHRHVPTPVTPHRADHPSTISSAQKQNKSKWSANRHLNKPTAGETRQSPRGGVLPGPPSGGRPKRRERGTPIRASCCGGAESRSTPSGEVWRRPSAGERWGRVAGCCCRPSRTTPCTT